MSHDERRLSGGETPHTTTATVDSLDCNTPLSIPVLPADVDTLTAALLYAECDWYVLPVKPGAKGKNPGSVVGNDWPHKSSRDPQVITAWFAGTDYAIALHCGRSGAVVLDVDKPDKVPGAWWQYLDTAPYQSSRPGTPRRGHYVFALPPGRTIGNPTRPWGEVRGTNGVIIVEPSQHKDGGEYRWVRR